MMNTSQPMSALTLWSETRFIQHIKNGVIFQEVTHISQSHMDWCTKSLWISKKRIAMSKENRTKRLWSVQSPWTRHVTQQTKLLSKCQFISWYRILITKWAKHKHSLAAYFLHIRKLHWKLIDNQILVIHCGLKTKGRVSSFSVQHWNQAEGILEGPSFPWTMLEKQEPQLLVRPSFWSPSPCYLWMVSGSLPWLSSGLYLPAAFFCNNWNYFSVWYFKILGIWGWWMTRCYLMLCFVYHFLLQDYTT